MRNLLLLIPILLLSSCVNSDVVRLFEGALKDKCQLVTDVKISGVNIGNFVLCTEDEYHKRTKK